MNHCNFLSGQHTVHDAPHQLRVQRKARFRRTNGERRRLAAAEEINILIILETGDMSGDTAYGGKGRVVDHVLQPSVEIIKCRQYLDDESIAGLKDGRDSLEGLETSVKFERPTEQRIGLTDSMS